MGLVLFVLLAIFATFFFAGASFQTVHLLITMPLIGLGLLYFFGEVEHEKLALFLIIGMPILIVLIGGIPQFVRVSQRVDDGNYGARVVDCQNHPTLWAPRGPGFPEEGVNWTDAEYVCAHLNEEGDALSDEALSLWRLPSVEEAVRCQMIHNENAGGVWNEETRQAEYEKRPDKETPLWVPDAEVIYYWTSDMSKETEDQAYIIDYKGGVFDKDIHSSPNYRSFRCVRDVPRDFTVAEVLEESCVQESDCIVPGDWAMRSVCPYETRCLEQRCTVVCPEPFSHPTP